MIWEDNYFSLLPGENRELTATYAHNQLQGTSPVVEVQGWNVSPSDDFRTVNGLNQVQVVAHPGSRSVL